MIQTPYLRPRALLIMLVAGFISAGCEHTIPLAPGNNNNPGIAAKFSVIQPDIFAKSCAGSSCHVGGQAAGLSLTAYANLINQPSIYGNGLQIITPGDTATSAIYLKITGNPAIGGSQMPLGGNPLADDAVKAIRDWIVAGAPDN